MTDCALGEHIRFPDKVALIIQNFQGCQQAVGTVCAERRGIGSGIDKAVLLGELIVKIVQLGLLGGNKGFREVLCLILDQLTNTIPDGN